jgi:hypothetical protein
MAQIAACQRLGYEVVGTGSDTSEAEGQGVFIEELCRLAANPAPAHPVPRRALAPAEPNQSISALKVALY